MKKIFVLLLLLVLVLCGCKKKEEYKLIEITGNELVNNIDKGKLNIVLAFYYKDAENSDQFLKDLEKVAKQAKEYVYYIDMDNIESLSDMIISDSFSLDDGKLKYCVYQDGVEIVNEEYTNFSDMFKNLNGKKYDPIELTSDEEVDQQLVYAQDAYDRGLISTSYSFYKNVWSSQKAKDEFNKHELFNLINFWEYRHIENKQMYYRGVYFAAIDNIVYINDYDEPLQTFKEPNFNDFEMYYYRVLDGKNICLYLSEENEILTDSYIPDNELKCKYNYEILRVSSDALKLKIDGKDYIFGK